MSALWDVHYRTDVRYRMSTRTDVRCYMGCPLGQMSAIGMSTIGQISAAIWDVGYMGGPPIGQMSDLWDVRYIACPLYRMSVFTVGAMVRLGIHPRQSI